jgi:hypothetical protein
MINSNIIDIAITLSYTYFLLSLIVTAILEVINTLRENRAKFLKNAIETLFSGDDWKEFGELITKSPFLDPLKDFSKNSKTNFPSYISPENFALIFYNTVKEKAEKDFHIIDLKPELNDKFKQLISNSGLNFEEIKDFRKFDFAYLKAALKDDNFKIPENLKKVMSGFIEMPEMNFEKFMAAIQKYFNESMDRLNGWYKKHVQYITFIVSFIITLSLNVDTISITKTLWEDQPKLKKVTNTIVASYKSLDSTLMKGQYSVDSSNVDSLNNKIIKNIENVRQLDSVLSNVNIPIGWNNVKFCESKSLFSDLLIKLIGLLITTIAISLGAPFWFDMLKKIISIRGVGKETENKEKDDKDKK